MCVRTINIGNRNLLYLNATVRSFVASCKLTLIIFDDTVTYRQKALVVIDKRTNFIIYYFQYNN